MFVLIADIFNHGVLRGPADAERCIPLLPGEPFAVLESVANPAGRVGLECVHQVGDGNRRWQGGIQMDMIRLAVGFYELGILETRYRAQVGMETGSPFRIN